MPPGEGTATEGEGDKDPRTGGGTTDDDDDDGDDDDDDDDDDRATRTGQHKDPTLITGVAGIGAALLDFGDLQISGAHIAGMIGAGYPLNFGKIGISVGGLFTFTPVSWNNGEMSDTSPLLGVLANVGVRYRVIDKLGVGGDLGAGGLFLGGLSEGNVFMPAGSTADGLLAMFNLRAGISGEYLITDNLVVSVSPVSFSFSPAHSSFRTGVDSLSRIELLVVGAGYRR
jgi:hypothetical protein